MIQNKIKILLDPVESFYSAIIIQCCSKTEISNTSICISTSFLPYHNNDIANISVSQYHSNCHCYYQKLFKQNYIIYILCHKSYLYRYSLLHLFAFYFNSIHDQTQFFLESHFFTLSLERKDRKNMKKDVSQVNNLIIYITYTPNPLPPLISGCSLTHCNWNFHKHSLWINGNNLYSFSGRQSTHISYQHFPINTKVWKSVQHHGTGNSVVTDVSLMFVTSVSEATFHFTIISTNKPALNETSDDCLRDVSVWYFEVYSWILF